MAFPEPLPAAEPKKNRTGLIIGVVVAILCCCCLVILIGGYTFGDTIMEMFRSL